eukprot:3981236-Prymnesium_polylepis.1
MVISAKKNDPKKQSFLGKSFLVSMCTTPDRRRGPTLITVKVHKFGYKDGSKRGRLAARTTQGHAQDTKLLYANRVKSSDVQIWANFWGVWSPFTPPPPRRPSRRGAARRA